MHSRDSGEAGRQSSAQVGVLPPSFDGTDDEPVARADGRMGGSEEPPKTTLIHYVISHPYHGYVLFLMTVVYLMNQLDRYIYSPDRPSFVSKHRT